MKKLYFLLSILLSNVPVCAMDSFYNKALNLCNYFKKPTDQQRFYLDELPLAVQGKIVINMFDAMLTNTITMSEDDKKRYDTKKLKTYVLNDVPIRLGLKFSYEFIQLSQICQSKIYGKKFEIEDLFCLSQREKEALRKTCNSDGYIDQVDYEIIAQSDREDIKKGLVMKVVPSGRISQIFRGTAKLGGSVFLFGGLLLLADANIKAEPGSLMRDYWQYIFDVFKYGGYLTGSSVIGSCLYSYVYPDRKIWIEKMKL